MHNSTHQLLAPSEPLHVVLDGVAFVAGPPGLHCYLNVHTQMCVGARSLCNLRAYLAVPGTTDVGMGRLVQEQSMPPESTRGHYHPGQLLPHPQTQPAQTEELPAFDWLSVGSLVSVYVP